MSITRALVIADPWIGLILSGQKTWEMRSRATEVRGWIGLIRKGSGSVCGVARLAGVGEPLSPEVLLASEARHRIPAATLRSGAVARWNVPWMLEDVVKLPCPVPYEHPSGAVTWVLLDAAVAEAVGRQVALREERDGAPASHRPALHRPALPIPAAAVSPPPRQAAASPVPRPARRAGEAIILGTTELTAGNIRNNHFYLRGLIRQFPDDAIGGSNRAAAARRMLRVDWGGPEPVETDIDGDKLLFRRRGWVGAFFARQGAAPGDRVLVEQTGPDRYRVSLVKSAN